MPLIEFFHQSYLIPPKVCIKFLIIKSTVSLTFWDACDIIKVFLFTFMSLFIIYTNQLRIHNKFALGNFKKNIFSANSTIQRTECGRSIRVTLTHFVHNSIGLEIYNNYQNKIEAILKKSDCSLKREIFRYLFHMEMTVFWGHRS